MKKFLQKIIFVFFFFSTSIIVVYAVTSTHSADFEQDSSQYFDVADATSLDIDDGWTVEFWYNHESIDTSFNQSFFFRKRTGENGIGVLLNDNGAGGYQLRVEAGSGAFDGTNATGVTFATSTWTHIAIFYNGANTKIYQDGSFVETISINAITTNAANLFIGSSDGTNNFLDGRLDEIRVWDDERTASEINDNKCVEVSASADGLQAYWQLDNDGLDETSNNNDLTNNNSVTFVTGNPHSDSGLCAVAPTGFNSFTIFD